MNNLADIDPRNLIRESYRIEGIHASECRSIFMDWVFGLAAGADVPAMAAALLQEYKPHAPDHPMTAILLEGVQSKPATAVRRGGRGARLSR